MPLKSLCCCQSNGSKTVLNMKTFYGTSENLLETLQYFSNIFHTLSEGLTALRGLFTWREEDSGTRMILEDRINFYFLLCLHAEISVHVVNSREGIKDERLPTEQPTRTLLAKAVYLVLGSSWCLRTSITLCINWIQKTYGVRMICLLGSSFPHVNSP